MKPTDTQIEELAKDYRCSHPGHDDWFDMPVSAFVKIVRAVAEETLERAAQIHDAEAAAQGRSAFSSADWHRHYARRIRALKEE